MKYQIKYSGMKHEFCRYRKCMWSILLSRIASANHVTGITRHYAWRNYLKLVMIIESLYIHVNRFHACIMVFMMGFWCTRVSRLCFPWTGSVQKPTRGRGTLEIRNATGLRFERAGFDSRGSDGGQAQNSPEAIILPSLLARERSGAHRAERSSYRRT